jgi:GH25 family lysozyme M1 (1,4-beta-N-acetylmuramidase)
MIKRKKAALILLFAVCCLSGCPLSEPVKGEMHLPRLALAASETSQAEDPAGSASPVPQAAAAAFDTGPGKPGMNRASTDSWQDFINEGYAFALRYPAAFSPENNPDQESLNAGLEVPEGTPVWQFDLADPALYSGTNLVKASLVVQISRGDDALSACSQPKAGSIYQLSGESLPSVEINGVSYLKDVVREGVMGGMYRRVSYRTISQDACYEITQVVESKNSESFPAGAMSRFDEEAVFAHLDQVLHTFRLLDSKAVFPEMIYPEQSTTFQALDQASGDYADGIDVSHWQGDIDWGLVGQAGYSFAFVKGTEGVGWTDVLFHYNMTHAPDSGIVRGVYHFARPDLDNTGQEEAEYFLSVAGDYLESGYLRPVLDLEVRGSLDKTALSAWVLEWLQTVENQSGVAPLIYTNLYFINNYLTDAVTEYDLWIAYWTNDCDSTVTFSIPPTGMWSDWAFWQYCVAPAGTVPGIDTSIDLDIFNGLESSLIEYDAASPLWVSLISDAYRASKPYYADLTADVNGDPTGLINYHIWWNCDSLEVDIASVESTCGVLPEPASGECLKDDVGMRCTAVDNETQLAEYTYQEIGSFTAKVIVERGTSPPAEDRYKISVVNPIRSITADPASPGVGEPYTDYPVQVDVNLSPTLDGVLQVEIIEDGTTTPLDSRCREVTGNVQAVQSFNLIIPWLANETGLYTIWARYRSGAACPAAESGPDDLSIPYEIDWHQLTFADVPFDHPHHLYIQALWDAGYTAGCSTDPLLYCPDTVMDRAQSAVFMLRGQLGTGYSPPPEPWDTFADDWSLSDISWAEKWAEGMWDEGLTAGCQTDPLMYCPRRELPRVEASVFGLRMKHGISYTPPPASGTLFADMTDPDYWGTKWAEQAYLDGLLPECGTQDGKPLFCPDDLLDRGWGAYLVVQAKDLPLP